MSEDFFEYEVLVSDENCVLLVSMSVLCDDKLIEWDDEWDDEYVFFSASAFIDFVSSDKSAAIIFVFGIDVSV